MFASIIQYKLNPIFEGDFITLWNQQQKILKERGLIYSSFLHRETRISFVSYTQWRTRNHFDENMVKPQGEMQRILEKQESYCNSIKIQFRLYTTENISTQHD